MSAFAFVFLSIFFLFFFCIEQLRELELMHIFLLTLTDDLMLTNEVLSLWTVTRTVHSANSWHARNNRASLVAEQLMLEFIALTGAWKTSCASTQYSWLTEAFTKNKLLKCEQSFFFLNSNYLTAYIYIFLNTILFISENNKGVKILRVLSHEMWPQVHLPLSSRPLTIPEPTVPAPPRTNTTLSELDMLAAASHNRRWRMENITQSARGEAADDS